jgi:putative phosphoribosyl transferase
METREAIPFFHHEAVPYRDRTEAGRRLAEAMAAYRGPDTLVLGIPRGGVPVAAEVACALGAELDVVVARKLGAPYQPELALGAITATGGLFLDQDIIDALGVTDDYLRTVMRTESQVAHRREERFRGKRPQPAVEGRTVLVVDDGLATGATMRAAVRSVRTRHPGKLVVAVPVGSAHACAALRAEVDEVICLLSPEPFYAVGLYYAHFGPVMDREVQRILEKSAAACVQAVAAAS